MPGSTSRAVSGSRCGSVQNNAKLFSLSLWFTGQGLFGQSRLASVNFGVLSGHIPFYTAAWYALRDGCLSHPPVPVSTLFGASHFLPAAGSFAELFSLYPIRTNLARGKSPLQRSWPDACNHDSLCLRSILTGSIRRKSHICAVQGPALLACKLKLPAAL